MSIKSMHNNITQIEESYVSQHSFFVRFLNFLIYCFLITEPFSFSLIKRDSPKYSAIILDANKLICASIYTAAKEMS